MDISLQDVAKNVAEGPANDDCSPIRWARRLNAGRVAVLDGVRGVAILLVIIFHGFHGSTTAPAVFQSRTFGELAHEGGHLGVDIFFVLSGYLITSILLEEYKRNGRIDLKRFYLRRTRRIFPAYYAFLAIVGALALLGILHVPLFAWLLSVTYLTDYSLGHSAAWIEHSWSLAVEEQFYLFWPALIMLLGLVRAKYFAFAVILALPFVRLGTYALLPHQRDFIDVMLHTRLDMLMFGAALAIGVSQRMAVLDRLSGRAGAFAASLAFCVLVGSVLLAARFHSAYLFTVGYSISGLCTATLLLALVSHPAWSVTKLLSLPPITMLGRISYSLYLWQQVFLTPENQTVAGRFPINFGCAVLCAVASYFLIERPFMRQSPVERSTLVPTRLVAE